jgi:NAD(P)-dependent dehydrogenase (short-subunit alcohol dehydrogenase family)
MSGVDLIDTLLDRTVVAGYSRPGLLLRRRLPGWPDEPLELTGKRVVVTGATGGIGRGAARMLAEHGADVVVVGRDAQRTEQVAAEIGGTARVCDVSRLSSLRAFTEGWSGPLDVLVNNAGVMPPQRTLTEDGVELAFATNVLGPWWLTRELSRHLPEGGRVINVSSGGMYGQRLDADLQNADYRPAKAYARTKRAEVVLTEMWAERLAAKGIVVHAMHPGWALTPGVESSLPRFRTVMGPILRTPEEGADTIVWLAGAPSPGTCSGLFWHDRRPRPTHLFGLNRESMADRQRLWDELVAIAGE